MSDNFLNPILVCKITTCVFSHIFLYKCINSVKLCKLILFVVMLCPFYHQNMAFSVLVRLTNSLFVPLLKTILGLPVVAFINFEDSVEQYILNWVMYIQ